MKIHWKLSGPKGPMADGKTECNFVSGIGEQIVLRMDKLPDEMQGQSILDWNKLEIEVTRE